VKTLEADILYFLYILFAIFIFGMLITVHELGHFLTAKLFKIKVNEFSIFMGPALWKKQRGETLYAIRCVPLGGYCAMEGEDGDSDDPRSFGNASWWKKVIVLAAGAGMNFLTGLVMLILMFGFAAGMVLTSPVLESVEEGSSMAGYLEAGDRIHAIDGERIYTGNDVTTILSLNLNGGGDTHDVVIIRDGKKLSLEDLNMEPRQLPDGQGGTQLRYGMNLTLLERNLGNVLSQSWYGAINYARNVRLSFQLIFRGDVSVKEVSGPVGIVKTIADVGTSSGSTSAGIWNVISLGAFIAVNLGVMNLLPIPALDGGRIVGVLLTTAVEGITRKKLNPKIEGYIHAGGMVLLMVLMVVILFKDVIQIVF